MIIIVMHQIFLFHFLKVNYIITILPNFCFMCLYCLY